LRPAFLIIIIVKNYCLLESLAGVVGAAMAAPGPAEGAAIIASAGGLMAVPGAVIAPEGADILEESMLLPEAGAEEASAGLSSAAYAPKATSANKEAAASIDFFIRTPLMKIKRLPQPERLWRPVRRSYRR
jgi:hypothetical protein